MASIDEKDRVQPAILILAAGSSSRMGQSKQLLTIDGEALLSKSIKVAIAAQAQTILVVLGANEPAHRNAIKDLPVTIVSNPGWRNGIGSSLKAGITYLQSMFPGTEAVVIMVCDQPCLTSEHLIKIISVYKTADSSIIASRYSGTAGIPALFRKVHYDELLAVNDEEGAKKIIQKNWKSVIEIDFPDGATDLDTPADLKRFTKSKAAKK